MIRAEIFKLGKRILFNNKAISKDSYWRKSHAKGKGNLQKDAFLPKESLRL